MSEQKAQPSVGVLEDRLEFETLIADASAGLLGCPPDEVERTVEHVLGRVREFFQADVCALLAARGEAPVVNVWLAVYGEGAPVVPTDVDLAKAFPWARRKMLVEREAVRVARTAEPPPGAEVDREAWKQMGVRSVLALPIEVAGDVRHFFVVETVHRERVGPPALATRS